MKKKQAIYIALFVFFALLLVVSAVMIVLHYSEEEKQEDAYKKLAETVTKAQEREEAHDEKAEPAEPSAPDPDAPAQMLYEYEAAYRENNDFVGWLTIEDTKINYPVVMNVDDPDYYLRHSFTKERTRYGCLYVQANCNVEPPSDNIIIHGHHMKNGSMLGELNKYLERSFWQTHKTFRFDTLYKHQTYEVLAAFAIPVETGKPDEFKYHKFTFAEDEAEFDAFVSRAKELSVYDTGTSAKYGDTLLTLSTCEYTHKNGRMVVIAKRVDNAFSPQ